MTCVELMSVLSTRSHEVEHEDRSRDGQAMGGDSCRPWAQCLSRGRTARGIGGDPLEGFQTARKL